jgi:hypothetical protein
MKERCRQIIGIGNRLFSDRMPLMSLWQELADNFYPERADFTTTRSIGTDFASHLFTGAPLLARRELANSLSAMLRPRGQQWFSARTLDEAVNEDSGNRQWLDMVSERMRLLMYDSRAQFQRATKEADNDFATFGQCVITADLDLTINAILYRCWHLRDVAWSENERLEVDTIHHKWKMSARDMVRRYGDKVDGRVRDLLKDEPHKKIECRRVVMPADEYDLKRVGADRAKPYVALHIDCENDTVLEEKYVKRINYVLPRWQTVSGSQYAHSPASVIALPDARLLQQITLTLLEAGQKSVDPPLVATHEAIQGGVNLYAGGVTWVDKDYDERLGDALRPLDIDRSGLNWGVDREERITSLIKQAFYLDELRLPDVAGSDQMTAQEVRIRTEEFMRRALPLFEPMETEYNGALCNLTFEIAMEQHAFGNPFDMPQALRGAEVRFQFESPIQQAANRANAQAFQTSANLLALAAQVDPTVIHVFDTDKAVRDALEGAGAPADWIKAPEVVEQEKAMAAEQAMAMQAAQEVAVGADIASKVGEASQQLQAGGVI